MSCYTVWTHREQLSLLRPRSDAAPIPPAVFSTGGGRAPACPHAVVGSRLLGIQAQPCPAKSSTARDLGWGSPASHLLFWPLQVLGLWAPPVATVPGRSSPVPALVRLRRRLRSQTGRLSRPVVHLGQDTVAQGFPLPLSCVLSYKLKCIAEHPIQQLSQRCDSVHRQSHTMCAAVSITVKGVGSRFSAGTKKRREITVVVASTVITS